MSEEKDKILIIGAGLCGSLLALKLVQKGYAVHLMERRMDLRKSDISAGRSINLALSDRGIRALESAGLKDAIQNLSIPMKGRMIHSKTGETFLSPYSGAPHKYIYSISRRDLNALLLNEVEKHSDVQIEFNQTCDDVNYDKGIAHFHDDESQKKYEIEAKIIFGTDGAGSALRKSYDGRPPMLFSHSIDFLAHGYKELTMPTKDGGGYRIDKNALHIWPRGNYMLIALANIDGSFTVTLFLPHQGGKYSFESLENPQTLVQFFKEEFPDAYEQMPNLVEEYYQHPIGNLGTVKCRPWNFEGKSLLMGDAAHAIVPFYGQGMNASFEDVYLFDEMFEKNHRNWEQTFEEFSTSRKPDTDAIADLAIDNFYEMRDHVANPYFQQKRQIEMKLEGAYPETYFSKYSLVTFVPTVPYSLAMNKGRDQDEVILQLLYSKQINPEMEPAELLKAIQQALKIKLETPTYQQILNETNQSSNS